MPFVEDPAHLSKSRLKSGLVANNVELPAAVSTKQVYATLHLKHTEQKKAADFSSDDDDDDLVQDGADDEDLDAEMSDPSSLTDDDLKAMLLKYGVTPGPIVASTRVLYERKLRKLQSEGHNGAENNVRYSDSEEEEDKESGLEEDVIKVSGQSQQASREMESRRSFSGSSDQEVNGSNVLERRSQSNRLDLQLKDKYTRADKSFYHTPKASRQEQETKVHREPVAEILKDIFPNTNTSPTGIYATPRRPIKGAAQRPVQYAYPDTPVSPVTQERREVERRLVPFKIQIVAFVAVTCVLYLIYVNAEHSGSVMALLESLNQWSD